MSSTAADTPPNSQQNGSSTDRRDRVMLGNLPDDFLSVPGGAGQPRMSADENIAHIMQAQQQVGYGFIPANTAGKCSITIIQGKLAKNYGLAKMDPYCRIRVGHSVFETPTSYNGAKNPRWNKSVASYLPLGVDSIFLEIFDERSFTMDERIAWSCITIPQRCFEGETVDDWFTLSGKQGDEREGMINLVLSFTPVQNTQQPPMPVQNLPQQQMVTYNYYPAQQPVGAYPPQQPPTRSPEDVEEDLKQVKEMFPNMDDEVIKSVYEANRGNKDASINSLLQMTAD